jgi:XRE family transcriptional regulator, regulator of sulfur utilization
MAPSSHAPAGLGKAIRQLREKRGMTQEGLAHEAGSTAATIGAIERGLTNPSWGTVEAIAAALGVSVVEVAKAAARLES